jgi:hypothetical protein
MDLGLQIYFAMDRALPETDVPHSANKKPPAGMSGGG